MRRLNPVMTLVAAGFATGITSAQTFETLHRFNGTDGAFPQAGLVQANNGYLYGTTYYGGISGPYGGGTVFKITPTGTLTTIHSFCTNGCNDGVSPYSALVGATNGDLYGTTSNGGANSPGGTVFRIGSSDTLTTLYSFCSQMFQLVCQDGSGPYPGLVQGANGDLYGVTLSGGNSSNRGTIFKITMNGRLTTLYTFCPEAGCLPDGFGPEAGLVQARNGNFYGTTSEGGANYFGTSFELTPSGTFTTLNGFCELIECGADPHAGLVQATNGDLYGTTFSGGAHDFGTVFKITPNGTLTTLYSFCSQTNCADGAQPTASLVQASDGNLYGTTTIGGAYGAYTAGTIFKITPAGTLTTIYNFCSDACSDGANPQAGLIQGTDGNLYGTTYYGGTFGPEVGANGYGTVFRLSVGLGPFVETRPSIGVAGEVVTIVGYGLKDVTSVTFNGTPATILYEAPTVIYARVPTGATTGRVEVMTPKGTLRSNKVFEVVPH